MEKENKNVFYFAHINVIGGVETFLYYLSCLYNNFVVYYKSGDYKQVERLGDNVEIHKWNGERIKCDRFFASYNPDILDYVSANEYIQVIHADYKEMELKPCLDKRITKYIGVSEKVCESFREITGRDIECIYNPMVVDKPRKVLKLISATRLTSEKGRNEMIKLGNELDKAGIPYLWFVFTNDTDYIDNPNIIYMEPRLDIKDYIASCDYLVQLSRTEAFCFSVVEAEMLGVPCIVRDLPVWSEIGLKNKENCFILDFDMNDIPVGEIYKGLNSFKYTPPKSKWDKYLDNSGSYDSKKISNVKARKKFLDIVGGKWRESGEEFEVTEKRKNILTDLLLIDII